ncbi:MAG: 50S ribosomal protein L20 [Candidatus Gracilibacteria bacterium]|nr:50S ribosomal protein L20 [Candidatus Gracilibacteria bacterium]
MTRVKRGVTAHRRHRKIVKAAKGFRGQRHKNFAQAKPAVLKQGLHSYVGRKNRKRVFRRLWIVRINAACRELGIKYSRLIDGLTKMDIVIDRKILADLAVKEPQTFKAIVEEAKKGL